eukprot:8917078-Pyramimonas_sp.AAC.1
MSQRVQQGQTERLVVPTQELSKILSSPPATNTTFPIQCYCMDVGMPILARNPFASEMSAAINHFERPSRTFGFHVDFTYREFPRKMLGRAMSKSRHLPSRHFG